MTVAGIIVAVKILFTLVLTIVFCVVLKRYLKKRKFKNDIEEGIKQISERDHIIEGKQYDLRKEIKKEDPESELLSNPNLKDRKVLSKDELNKIFNIKNEAKQAKPKKAHARKSGNKPTAKRGPSGVRGKRK